MRTDMPAEIWLDPYRWEALQEILEQDGTDIEEVLQNYLIEVYSDRVPIERQKEVDRRIKKERLAAVQEAEARKVFCAMHIREHGQEYILMEKNGREFLQVAVFLRRYLRNEFTTPPREFAQVFDHAEEIPAQRFRELAELRLENTGKVSGILIWTKGCSPVSIFQMAGRPSTSKMCPQPPTKPTENRISARMNGGAGSLNIWMTNRSADWRLLRMGSREAAV
jgi:hypothetical protein